MTGWNAPDPIETLSRAVRSKVDLEARVGTPMER